MSAIIFLKNYKCFDIVTVLPEFLWAVINSVTDSPVNDCLAVSKSPFF